ncbi:hypothetical protein [Pandoraea sputorum]|uniref:hypothetical protein n=1 Tax=Pandoraea sputorum TaxID=93222 RepID=UPI002F90C282
MAIVVGCEAFDAAGRRIFDGTGRIPRTLGLAYLDGVNSGYVTHPAFLTGEILFSFQLAQLFSDVRAYKRMPVIEPGVGILSWSYPAPQGTQYGCPGYLIYGAW